MNILIKSLEVLFLNLGRKWEIYHESSVQRKLIRTKNFGAVVLSSFIIIQIFFSAVIFNAFGLGSALFSFVKL